MHALVDWIRWILLFAFFYFILRYFHVVCRYSKLRRIEDILLGPGFFIFIRENILCESVGRAEEPKKLDEPFCWKGKKGRSGRTRSSNRKGRKSDIRGLGRHRTWPRSTRRLPPWLCASDLRDVWCLPAPASSKAPYLFESVASVIRKRSIFFSQLASDISIPRRKFVWTRVEFHRSANYKRRMRKNAIY